MYTIVISTEQLSKGSKMLKKIGNKLANSRTIYEKYLWVRNDKSRYETNKRWVCNAPVEYETSWVRNVQGTD